jgi:hypothetical protein
VEPPLGLHGRVDILKDDERLSPHSNITLSYDLHDIPLTSIIYPYSSKFVNKVSLSSSMGTFSLRLLI